jgi:hypothetical protein
LRRVRDRPKTIQQVIQFNPIHTQNLLTKKFEV